ncbi:MAG: Trk system potassium transporter TrkA [Clostridiales bacterium]|nr:Trk system potassium transporter TrkA [Clostridiales bacterium]
MKIVIVGSGKIGYTLTKFLTSEGHDITVIDTQAVMIEEIANAYDVLGIVGNGASVSIQREAEVSKCDFFISCAASDETNIMACIVAKTMGAEHTIARIRNPEYYTEVDFIRQKLGIDMIVNPELEAAFEIERMIRFPEALKVERFAKGRVDLIELKVKSGHFLDGKKLSDFRGDAGNNILVCAVQRGDHVMIPDGEFVLCAEDRIHITAPHVDLVALFRNLKIQAKKIKTVLLIGGGKIAYYLAKRLLKLGMSVKIIENDRRRCDYLSGALPKASVIWGDGTDSDLLLEEGIGHVDACVALTDNDEENILISLFASTKDVDKTIIKIKRISFMGLLSKINYEGSMVSPVYATAYDILRYVRATENAQDSSLNTLYKIADNKAEVIEFTVTKDFAGIDVALKDLKTKSHLIIAGIIHDNTVIYPDGASRMQENDRVIIVTTNEGTGELNDILL